MSKSIWHPDKPKHVPSLLSLFLLVSLMAGQSFSQPSLSGRDHHWTKLSDSADFPKSYNFQLINIRDTIWACHSEGMWYSVDGTTWYKSPLPNIIHNVAFLDYVYYKDALYGLGTFEGNIERYTLTTAIYKTDDLRTWKTLATESNLPKRFFYHPFVFKDKLWIIGGNDGKKNFADAWNSSDAVHWKKVADGFPFGPREGQQFVVKENKLFMLAQDVWSSTDGINWKMETDRITHGNFYGYTAVVFDNRIWLLGCNRDGHFESEVMVSSDGKQWDMQRAPWSPRGGIAACVHKGRIVMTGGKYGGPVPKSPTGVGGQDENHPVFIYSNDVWTLERK